MAKKPQLFSEQLRKAITECGVTRYRISKETGISEALLSRFVHNDVGLSLTTIDTLCEYLGAQLSVEANNPKGRK